MIGFFYNGKDAFLSYTEFSAPPLYHDIDSLYGVTRQRNSKQMVNYPWGGIVTKTNSLGFIDNEFINEGLLITGNSFVEGYGVSAENRFSEILEKQLNINNINNAGSGGVWTPIQSLMVLRELINNKKMGFKKSVIILSPGEVVNLDKRSPVNDLDRNYPYRDGDSINFHKATNSSFSNELAFSIKSKRFFKSLLISKIYYTFKYYGAAKLKTNFVDFDKNKLDWFTYQIEKEKFKQVIDVIIINNLGRIKINKINNYTNKSAKVRYHIVDFPDELANYFVSNGHLNEKGNEVLANLLIPLLKTN